MKLLRLWIDRFKNLRNCEIHFERAFLLNTFIGGNGSGKSNLIEAILHILLDTYLNKTPPFDFRLEYEAQRRHIVLSATEGCLRSIVDDREVPLKHFTRRLRDGEAQVFYPETTFAYYSGDCARVARLLKRYTASFRSLVREPGRDNYRPLFVLSTNQQARHILLALIAHRHVDFFERLDIAGACNIKIVLQSPKGFDPEKDEPILWGTTGKVGRVISALAETADLVESHKVKRPIVDDGAIAGYAFTETRTYTYEENMNPEQRLWKLALRLERGHDNLYLSLEHLAARGMLKSVTFDLVGEANRQIFDFDQLSEGEKQLIAVIGAIRLTNQRDNLILLDEPDTHLNPQWSWEYPELLDEAFNAFQKSHSTVLMATHDPVVISGLVREQIFLAHGNGIDHVTFDHPYRHPRGQGVANLLCSSEFFGLPSSLDKKTQALMDERLRLSLKETLTEDDKQRLKELNADLEILQSGISERDPDYVAFLRSRHEAGRGGG
ncbi:AAA family ATPase [Sulfidibacter corallicola]|uniref:AAA family ATPase n=1 Tax=Sulfidibacter corallicola TaxID=2818388 RepID=A0A8A4TW70_SULCO|nr:ATP-binding protein [Sulfidibacter corallicola]QTD53212.1 AAA family ATPase [Sulfidibacter corallicola]